MGQPLGESIFEQKKFGASFQKVKTVKVFCHVMPNNQKDKGQKAKKVKGVARDEVHNR